MVLNIFHLLVQPKLFQINLVFYKPHSQIYHEYSMVLFILVLACETIVYLTSHDNKVLNLQFGIVFQGLSFHHDDPSVFVVRTLFVSVFLFFK